MTETGTGISAEHELVNAVWREAHELVKRLEGSSVQRLSIEAGGTRIEIERGLAPVTTLAPGAPALAPSEDGAGEVDGRRPVKAPLVGTFYRAEKPGADPFVKVGDVVEPGQTVAIVEAMKLMNQVQADVHGTVAEILVENGEWVEFEQVLMYLDAPQAEE